MKQYMVSTREGKSITALAKEAFNKEKTLYVSKLIEI